MKLINFVGWTHLILHLIIRTVLYYVHQSGRSKHSNPKYVKDTAMRTSGNVKIITSFT